MNSWMVTYIGGWWVATVAAAVTVARKGAPLYFIIFFSLPHVVPNFKFKIYSDHYTVIARSNHVALQSLENGKKISKSKM